MKFFLPIISALFAMIAFGPVACTKGQESEVKAELPAGYRLSNPSAGEKTKAVYRFLCENFGRKILVFNINGNLKGDEERYVFLGRDGYVGATAV